MLSETQRDRIYQAWSKGTSPVDTAKTLRLAYITVLKEYLRLDGAPK